MRFWLVKSEPDVFSFDDLVTVGSTWWDGVRNYQARSFLREMRVGDLVVVYHSNAKPSDAAGIATVRTEHRSDRTQFDPSSPFFDPAVSPASPRWVAVELVPLQRLKLVPLDVLRNLPEFAASPLVAKGSRLSVIPLDRSQFIAVAVAGAAAQFIDQLS